MFRIFPTTKKHFKVGERVAWEWSFDESWGQSWYKAEDGKCKKAWLSSAEFVGRHLQDV